LFSKKITFLLDWNWECLSWLQKNTGLNAAFSRSSAFEMPEAVTAATDLRNHFNPKKMVSNDVAGLTYRQVFEDRFGFQRGLSVLDFLFCAGGKAVKAAGIAQAGIDPNQ
jgi:hypothetical protein